MKLLEKVELLSESLGKVFDKLSEINSIADDAGMKFSAMAFNTPSVGVMSSNEEKNEPRDYSAIHGSSIPTIQSLGFGDDNAASIGVMNFTELPYFTEAPYNPPYPFAKEPNHHIEHYYKGSTGYPYHYRKFDILFPDGLTEYAKTIYLEVKHGQIGKEVVFAGKEGKKITELWEIDGEEKKYHFFPGLSKEDKRKIIGIEDYSNPDKLKDVKMELIQSLGFGLEYSEDYSSLSYDSSYLRGLDKKVRTHEEAHYRALGKYAKGISYRFQKGPDGHQYAVNGQVYFDASVPKNKSERDNKFATIRAAALAPEKPSDIDNRIHKSFHYDAPMTQTTSHQSIVDIKSAVKEAIGDRILIDMSALSANVLQTIKSSLENEG